MTTTTPQSNPQSSTSPWIILAITSGAFAALNGVFAKLYVNQSITQGAIPPIPTYIYKLCISFKLYATSYTRVTLTLAFHRTTDNHTTAFAQSLAHLFGLDSSPVIEMLTRGVCLHIFLFIPGLSIFPKPKPKIIRLLQRTYTTMCINPVFAITNNIYYRPVLV
jgi:hypothetical protein